MSVRSFTVFLDTPYDDALARPPSDSPPTSLPTLAAVEKENLHPVTGQRAGPTIPSEAKKRKTAALAAKPLPAPATKKHKELKTESKKARRPLGAVAKPRSADSKSSKPLRASRRASPLPPVVEEQDLRRQPPRLSTSQIGINSRCYELTVSPLADVSEAYDATRAESQEPDAHSEKESLVDTSVRDYLPTTNSMPSTTDDSSCLRSDLATPKRICATFTFSSPSPTSERFKQARSSPAVPDSPTSHSE